MRIALVDLRDPAHVVVDKTIAGGMGTATRYGRGPFTRALTRIKASAIRLAPYPVAYAAAMVRAQGFEPLYHPGGPLPQADRALVFTSIPSLAADQRFLTQAAREGLPTAVVGTLAGVAPERFEGASVIVKGEVEALLARSGGLDGWRPGAMERLDVGLAGDLDDLPRPDWSIFPRLDSRYAILTARETVLPAVTSRGCPYPCGHYCPYPLGEGTKMRFRDPEGVVAELKEIYLTHGVRAFKFRDPIFTIHRARTLALLDALEAAGLPLIWGCETHLGVLDEALIRRMARAGCRMIQTGIETTDEGALKASHRRDAPRDHQRAMLKVMAEEGIKAAIYFILGLPGDTLEGMERSIAYGLTLPASFIQLTVCTPYPGTAFWDEVAPLLTTDDWAALDQYTPVLRSERWRPEELTTLMGQAYRRFYGRPGWVAGLLQTLWAGRRWPTESSC